MTAAKKKRQTKREKFVEEYLIDLNATQAAIRAGYSAKTAQTISSELMTFPEITAAIQAAKLARSAETKVTAVRVVEEMAAIAFADPGDILDFSGPTLHLKPTDQISERARRSISSIKVKRQSEGFGENASEVEIIEFRFWDKNAALGQLAKHTGAVKDKFELEGDLTLNVVEKIVDRDAVGTPQKDGDGDDGKRNNSGNS